MLLLLPQGPDLQNHWVGETSGWERGSDPSVAAPWRAALSRTLRLREAPLGTEVGDGGIG